MQYSMMNYGYFLQQITTFIYLPVNFFIILVKLTCTEDITAEMLAFPQWKFLIMGFFDSLQGLLITVGGLNVPGIMQNLLLQGSVPVTMIFSLLMLRNRGDSITRTARQVLKNKGINFTEEYIEDHDILKHGDPTCRILVNRRDVGKVHELLRHEQPPEEDILLEFFTWIYDTFCCCFKRKDGINDTGSIQMGRGSLSHVTLFSGIGQDELDGEVVLVSNAHTWGKHLKSFYSAAQYVGALIIMSGLVVSVWPDVVTGGAGQASGDIVFFCSTIPIAVSAVYKEIAFKSVSDMDVWYLNGYVAVPQFVLGLLYAPLAAYMTKLPLHDIPSNLWNGLQCWLLGRNFITRDYGWDCSEEVDCGGDDTPMCCDSCDGRYPRVSALPALWGVLAYMFANICYNIFLVLVIKHGSAALMYATSTLVLPLGSVAFTIHALMGLHAKDFTPYTGGGLGVVLLGLFIYRFVDMYIKSRQAKKDKESQ